LPYDTYVYRTHGSAVFDECVGLGVSVVAPMACDFAKSAIAEGRAIGIESVTAEGVASAVATAADRLDAITEQAAAERSVDTGLSDVLKSASAAAGARLSWLDRLKKRWRRRGGAAKSRHHREAALRSPQAARSPSLDDGRKAARVAAGELALGRRSDRGARDLPGRPGNRHTG